METLVKKNIFKHCLTGALELIGGFLPEISQNSPSMSELGMSGLTLDDNFLKIFFQNLAFHNKKESSEFSWKSLKILDLDHNTHIQFSTIALIPSAAPHLVELSLRGCKNAINDEVLPEIVNGLLYLDYLDVRDCVVKLSTLQEVKKIRPQLSAYSTFMDNDGTPNEQHLNNINQ
jgi:hypothetical protein